MKISLSTIVKIYLPLIIFIIITTVVTKLAGISMYQLVADPTEVSHQPAYVGMFSLIGSFCWCATSAICIFSALILRPNNTTKFSQNIFLFLLFSGIISTQLLLDDTFQLHEQFSFIIYGFKTEISRSSQNLAEMLVFAIYGIEFATFILLFGKLILASRPLFLALTVMFFGISTILDMTPEEMHNFHIVEEYFKLLGIFSWLMYYFRFCTEQVKNNLSLKSS
ncbi:hypothetical protein [Calothrix sp. 336/3]|uniref:hypothetical protein n=1 Tax=Calothrix sp. 336/3 TaxID=1337936 RepID=UPI0004E45E22|nr:hypothetical protein [Calothrix sp. 336/3]AKG20512.1 hypothetical protein IJ00_03560 [Calothrix sp. 336/3]